MKVDEIPRAPGGWPLVGHGGQLLSDPLGFLRSLPAHGDLVRIRLGAVDTVVVCDVELTRQLLLDDRTFDKGGPAYDGARELLGGGLLTCPRDAHRRRRRLAQPAFQPARLDGYTSAMVRQNRLAVDGWRNGGILDVMPQMLSLMVRTLAETMFSSALSPGAVDRAVEDLTCVVRESYTRAILPPALGRLPTAGKRRYDAAQARLRCVLDEVVAGYRVRGEDRGDLLSALMGARSPEDAVCGGLSDAELSDQMITFFVAGAETNANLLSWVLHLLSRHPEIEARLHEEVDGCEPAGPDGRVCPDRAVFTGRVVREALRLYPPVWLTTRRVTTDTVLGGQRFAAGSVVAYSPYLIHHRADIYPAPERFDPDRWDPSRPAPPRHAFLPFGAGARKCIGDRFALTEAVLALVAITRRWRLTSVSDRPVRVRAAATISPHSLRLRAVDRTVPVR
ncbi:cytochrome P450 [Embleya sp. NPDC059259]|uniref:cytochrome P450 n=1 Tax=unclassified Embleya TaxID=2699296 RepID=UPI003699E059